MWAGSGRWIRPFECAALPCAVLPLPQPGVRGRSLSTLVRPVFYTLRRLAGGAWDRGFRPVLAIFPLTDSANDEPTADLLTQRMQIHEKTAWMLRAMLGQ